MYYIKIFPDKRSISGDVPSSLISFDDIEFQIYDKKECCRDI